MPVVYTTTVEERIAEVIEARLQLLVAGSSALAPVSEVIRPLRSGGYTPKDWQIVLTLGPKESVPDLNCPGNPPAMAYDQTYNIFCRVMASERDDTPVDAFVSAFLSEAQMAITNSTTWYQMNGYSIDAVFDSPEYVEGGGGGDGATIPLRVTYRVSENNPYEVRA